MYNKFKQTIMVALLSLMLLACEETKTDAVANSPAATELPVDVVTATEAALEQKEVISGSLRPIQEVVIVSEISQKILKINFKDGQFVQKGELLYKLNDAELKARLKEVRAGLKLARVSESRLKNLLDSETVRAQEYDEAYSRLQAMEAQEELLLTEIAKTEIRAPFSGTIGISKVEVGSYVAPGLELANLQNQESVKIMFSVPERYLPLVKPGSKVLFMTQLSEQKLPATITASEAGLDAGNRSLNVQAVAKNPGRNYRGGLSAKVFFNTAAPGTKGITVPSHALIPWANGYNVYVMKDGKAALVPVTISNRTESDAVISEGLAANDIVIVSNIMRLGEGTPVKAVTNQN